MTLRFIMTDEYLATW